MRGVLLYRGLLFALAFSPALFGVLVSPALAEVFWTEGFEAYPNGSPDGRDTTWQAGGWVEVVPGPHSGNKSLELFVSHVIGNGWARWFDDTPSAPHGGLIEFSWWMLAQAPPHWTVIVSGGNGGTVAQIANDQVGSLGTIDAWTPTGWTETAAMVPADDWRNVSLQLDFASRPNRYRVHGAWGDSSDWYTAASNEVSFRTIQMSTRAAMDVNLYFDDFSGSIVPEPSTLLLLATFGVAGVFIARRRAGRAVC
jgi:hypothetical protein